MLTHLSNNDFFTDPLLPLTVIRRTPQIPFPIHTHDFSELIIVYGGEGIHFTENEEYLVRSGDIFVVQGNIAHGYKHPDNLMLINIIFDPELLLVPESDLKTINGYHVLFKWEPKLREKYRFKNRLRVPLKELEQTLTLVEVIEKELTRKKEGYRFMTLSFFMQLCGFLSRLYTKSSIPQMTDFSRISKILTILENNDYGNISISKIIENSGFSESTLLRLFHKTIGFSPIEYHCRLRIRAVCRELRHTDKTITEIAYELGYCDSNYLSRQFKKVMGVSPLQFRKDLSFPGLQDY